jgi:hypothetical protein
MEYNSSEQTIGWFKDRYLEGNLEIKPPYQRRPVWAPRQKSNLVESILLGLPVPEIYIHSTTSAEGVTHYAVVDGQQRVRSVLQFVGIDKEEGEAEFNGFPLEGLEPDSTWRNTKFADLATKKREKFFGYKFSVRFLTDATDAEVRDMFRRLNKFVTKLSDQELRNAIYSGPFIQLSNSLADDDYWAENRIVSPAIIRRMKDIEFISELLIGLMHGPQGGGGQVIDDYYRQMEEYEDEFPDQKQVKRLYDRTLAAMQSIFPEIKKTRWRNRTDFYSLFVAIGSILGEESKRYSAEKMRSLLTDFAEQVDKRMSDEEARVSDDAAEYTAAVQRGSSDKSRRAVRHKALLNVLTPLLKRKRD